MSNQRWKNTVAPGGGGDAGTLANPWLTEQSMLDGVAADDAVDSYGPETLSASPTSSTAGAEGQNIFITGKNASYVDDGTMTVIDADSTAAYGISLSHTHYSFKNYEWKNATSRAFYGNTGSTTLNNCIARATSLGIWIKERSTISNCQVISCNTGMGGNGSYNNVTNSVFSHGTSGAQPSGLTNFTDCLFYDFSTYAIGNLVNGSTVQYCTIDECGIGVDLKSTSTTYLIKNCLFTNCTIGIGNANSQVAASNNAFFNCTDDKEDANDYIVVGGADIALGAAPYSDPSYASTRDYSIASDNEDLLNLLVTLNGNGNLSYQSVGGVIPTRPTGIAPVFAGLTSGQMLSDGSLALEWTAGTGATQYEAFVSTSPITYAAGEKAGIVNFGINKMRITQTGAGVPLVPGTLYYYAVRALKIDTSAADSNVVTGSYTCIGRGTAPVYVKNAAGS